MNIHQEETKTQYEQNTRQHEFLIRNVVRSFVDSKVDLDDLMQVGRLAAYRASAIWQPRTGLKYQTFVSFQVMNECRRYIQSQGGAFQLDSRMQSSVRLVLNRRDDLRIRLGRPVTAEEVFADFQNNKPVIMLRNDARRGSIYRQELWSLRRIRTVLALESNMTFDNIDDVSIVPLHPKTVFEPDLLVRFEIEELFTQLLPFDRRILILASRGYDASDISVVLGLEYSNVKARLFFARKRARRHAEKRGLFSGRYTGDYDVLGEGNPGRNVSRKGFSKKGSDLNVSPG
jgi:DNA-directed RNA polymerase specialized sigma24 family protein